MKKSRNKVLVSVLVLLTVFVITSYSFFRINQRNIDQCIETLRNVAQTTDSRMNSLVDSYFSSLENLARVLAESDLMNDSRVHNQIIYLRVGAMESSVRMYLPDKSACTENGMVSDISDYMDYDELLLLADEDGRYISHVMKDYFNSDKPIIEQCYVVKKYGEPICVLSIVVDLWELSDFVTSSAFSGKAGMYIVDRTDGTVFLDTETGRVESVDELISRGNVDIGNSEFKEAVMSGQEMHTEFLSNLTGNKRSIYILNSFRENWEIMVAVDNGTAYAGMAPIRNILLNLSGMELVIFVVYLIWITAVNKKEMGVQKKQSKEQISTLRKQVELQEELAKERELLQDFHEMIHSGMWKQEFTNDGRIKSTWFSDDFRHMLGFENEEDFPDKAESLRLALHPDDREDVIRKTDEIFHSKKLKDCERYDMTYRLQRKNAEYRWYHVIGKISRFEEGMAREVTGIFIDVTAEKENELNRIQLKRNFDIIKILASEYSSVYFIDVETSILTPYSLNPELERQYGEEFRKGISFSEAMRHYIENSVYEADREILLELGRRDNLYERLKDKKSFSVIFRKKNDACLELFELKFVKVDDEKAAPTGIAMGFANRNREILNSYVMKKLMDDYIAISMVDVELGSYQILKEPEGLENEKYGMLPWTERVRRISLECSEDTRDVVFEFDTMDNIRRTLKSIDKREFLFKFRTEDRINYTWRRVELQVVERREGIPVSVIVAFSMLDDVTSQKETLNLLVAEQNNLLEDQKKQLEIQQKALEEALVMAQSANKAKTTFLNNMSHDIRTPMNAIIGYTGLAIQHINSRELVNDYLRKISQSSDHLLSLINDVLDMSRIESGKVNISEKEENLSEILHSLRDIVQSEITAKQLDFFMDSQDVNDENVICDKLRLKQVLLNVISNAIKYTPAGGKVIVRTIEKSVSETGYGSFEFRIQDTGIGMTQEFLKTIYDPFTRMNSSTVSGIQGTGLGMAITKNIINMMGGSIDINSEEGKGTEVIIDFDFRLLSDPKIPEKIHELEGRRCLVVDDDSNTCRSVAKMLREAGLRSEWCVSGREAVFRAEDACAAKDDFDVYFIDWILPDQNGLETVRKIRTIVGPEVPVIIMTAYDWADVEEESKAAGVTRFVNKPLFPSDLNRVLLQSFNISGKDERIETEKIDFNGRRILLVEDNPLNMEIAVDILANNGITVFTAEDGIYAVDMMKNAARGDYDAILMDIQMPKMNGYEATRQIRKLGNEYAENIPIIAMTANAFEEDRREAMEAGMNEHIAKPVRIEVLKEVLARFLK